MHDPALRPVRKRRAGRKKKVEPKLSRQRPPSDMPVEAWQSELRRQFGQAQVFEFENIGTDPVFSEFRVSNPASGGRYRVAVRGAQLGDNYCSCPDFATNELGTCKHIEFLLARLARKRGVRARLERGFEPPYSEVYLHYAAARRVRFRPGVDCPAQLLTAARRTFDETAGWTLPQERFTRLEGFLERAAKVRHEVRCYEDALRFIAHTRDAAERDRMLREAYPRGAGSAALRKLLRIPLYPYQAEGALFAARAGRALIGDEMGLGKTIQAIAATELLSRHFGAERVLVICPTSVKHQWQREVERCTARDARVIFGLRAKRETLYREAGAWKVTNYETLSRDLDLIEAWAPDVVIVDEAQRIKNWNTIAARTLKRLSAPYALVLTGTPLENRLEELISIVQFVDQHRLGATWRLLHEHQVRDEVGRVVGYRDLDRLGRTLAPVLIRRRKTEVLEQLPERIDNTVFIEMTPEQWRHHDENREIVARIVARWRKTGYLSEADQRRLTCCLQNMRMSCNSTYLLDGESDHGYKADELEVLLEELFERPDSKVVVFSQWLRTHELIVRRLEPRRWGHVLFHGGVPGPKRAALIDRFTTDPDCRVFLSTDAGGVGLNLQHAASAVVNMDQPWNPAVLEQRIGRVHRLGQQRSVQVVNFVAQGTIEEAMLSTLAFKRSLFAGVLDGGESEVFLHGSRLTRFMRSVEAVTQATPAAGIAESVAPALGEPEPIDTVAEGQGSMPAGDRTAEVATAADHPTDDAIAQTLSTLVEAGASLLEVLAANSGRSTVTRAAGLSVERDASTGESYLRLPMPSADAVQRLAGAFAMFISKAADGR